MPSLCAMLLLPNHYPCKQAKGMRYEALGLQLGEERALEDFASADFHHRKQARRSSRSILPPCLVFVHLEITCHLSQPEVNEVSGNCHFLACLFPALSSSLCWSIALKSCLSSTLLCRRIRSNPSPILVCRLWCETCMARERVYWGYFSTPTYLRPAYRE